MHDTQQKNTTRGFTLFYAVLISSLLLAMGLAILNIAYKEFVLSSGARDSETAFYAADTALECALYWDTRARVFGYFGDSLAGGLRGYWRFEETGEQQTVDDPIAIDSSGSGNHLAVYGSPTWTSDGVVDQALTFNGSPTNNLSNPDFDITGAFSISFWIYPFALADWNQQVRAGNGWGAFVFHTAANGGVYVGTDVGAGQRFTPTQIPAGTVQINTWQHFTYTQDDNGNARFYKNGLQVGPMLDLPMPGAWGGFVVGNNQVCCSANGRFDDIRIYGRALTSDEVTAIAGFSSLAGFVQPLDANEAGAGTIMCGGDDINDLSGWWQNGGGGTGWYREALTPDVGSDEYWVTTFDVMLSDTICALVQVYKDDKASTTIISRGYSTCDLASPRRLERAIRAHY